MGHISTRDMFEILSELRTTEGKLDDLMKFAEDGLVKPVRYRECKYAQRDVMFNNDLWCDGIQRKPDFYCADGERRESE